MKADKTNELNPRRECEIRILQGPLANAGTCNIMNLRLITVSISG